MPQESILYVSPTAIHGGAEEALLHIMTAARELDYRPILVAPVEGWLTEHCLQRDIPYELMPGLPDVMVSENWDWKRQLKPWIPNAIAIAQLVRKRAAAIVHCNSPRMTYHGGLAARLASAASVTHIHDMINSPYASKTKTRLLDALTDRLLVPSRAVEQSIRSYASGLRTPIQTLYNGWDPGIYAPVAPADLHAQFGVPHGAFVIGSVSAMAPMKGQDVLIEAFQVLQSRVPHAHLMIVGGSHGNTVQSAYEAHLRQMVRDDDLLSAVTFTGWREDVLSLMKSMDIVAHVPTQFDALPTVLLHACALRRAIVASTVGGIPEIVLHGNNGLLVPPSDPYALGEALCKMISEPVLRNRYSEQAYAHVTRTFSPEAMRDGLAHAYQHVLSAPRQPRTVVAASNKD